MLAHHVHTYANTYANVKSFSNCEEMGSHLQTMATPYFGLFLFTYAMNYCILFKQVNKAPIYVTPKKTPSKTFAALTIPYFFVKLCPNKV